MSSLVPIRIESIAHGGDGVGTLPDGKRVFVPLAAPGDLVEVRLLEERERHGRGEITRLFEAGPGRREPDCPHFGACGGCQLQHLDDSAQRAAKEEAFYDALARLGACPRDGVESALAIVPSPAAFGYRIRCKLGVRGRQAGFLRRQSNSLEALAECRLLVPALEALALRVIERQRR
ncbi:MAG TPA: TRAM domain-containing protein, partial [Vulgatibacter sp.]